MASSSELATRPAPFPNPFLDYLTIYEPQGMTDVLRWAQIAWTRNGTYRRSAQRIVRYFLTDIDWSDADDDEIQKWRDYVSSADFNILNHLAAQGDDFYCYGNSFSTTFPPFVRYLRCPKCGLARPIQAWDYKLRNLKFMAAQQCPGMRSRQPCKYTGELQRLDRPVPDKTRIRAVRWNPHRMHIMCNLMEETRYLMDIEPTDRRMILSGDPFYIETLPWEILETVFSNRVFQFEPDSIYHMREPALSGYRLMGWGIPPVLSCLSTIFYIQILRRADEALALDYILPLRILSPHPASSRYADPLKMNMGVMRSQFMRMIHQRRIDPAAWNFLPFPVTYQAHGSEAKLLSTPELMTAANDELLNSVGIPPELYRMNLTTQGAPMALRLFQQSWASLVTQFNAWIEHEISRIATIMLWDKPSARLRPSSLADDIERRQLELQLAAANRISVGSAIKPLGLDYKEELKRRMAEQRMETEEMDEFNRDMMDRQFAGLIQSGAGGGMPSMGSPGPAHSVSDVQERARAEAEIILQMPTLKERRDRLRQIRSQDETLAAAVRAEMDKLRSDAESIGRRTLSPAVAG